ncbi:MAG: AAA family ATPase [Chloroflexi bacterium]|nr:MAG: AAA family ATPase [Chloroflexota bacterium]
MLMFSFVSDIEEYREGWLEPETQELLHVARKVVARLERPVVASEHFFLVACSSNHAMRLLEILGADRLALRDRLVEIIGADQSEVAESGGLIPLASDLQECIDRTFAVVIYTGKASLIAAEHILLGIISQERTRALLGTLLPPIAKCIERLKGSTDGRLDLAGILKELADLDVRHMLRVQAALHTCVLSEHALLTLAQVDGLQGVMHEVRSFVEQSMQPQHTHAARQDEPRYLLLVGKSSKERHLVAEAVAGELGASLVSLAFSAIVTMIASHECSILEPLKGEGFFVRSRGISAYGSNFVRDLLQRFFVSVQRKAPAVVLLEDLDAVNRLASVELRELVLKMLFTEIDVLSKQGLRPLLMATVQHLQAIDHLLLQMDMDCFVQRLVVDCDVRMRQATSTPQEEDLCVSCMHPIAPEWKHCIYCGISLEKVCPRCGVVWPDIVQLRFCSECGHDSGEAHTSLSRKR